MEKLSKIKLLCKQNIARIERLTENNNIATNSDLAMLYVYRKILNIIESEDIKND